MRVANDAAPAWSLVDGAAVLVVVGVVVLVLVLVLGSVARAWGWRLPRVFSGLSLMRVVVVYPVTLRVQLRRGGGLEGFYVLRGYWRGSDGKVFMMVVVCGCTDLRREL